MASLDSPSEPALEPVSKSLSEVALDPPLEPGSWPLPEKIEKLSRDALNTNSIQILVGEDEVPFTALKYQICQVSDFFKAACKEHWACGKERIIRLKEDDAKIFAIFLTWVVTKDINLAEDLIEIDSTKEGDLKEEYENLFIQLADCFFLASSLQCYEFQNKIMDRIVFTAEKYKDNFDFVLGTDNYSTDHIYKNTVPYSPIRRFIVDSFVSIVTPESIWIGTTDLEFPLEYIKDVLQSALQLVQKDGKRRRVQPPWSRSLCNYHQHSDQGPGYTCTWPDASWGEDDYKVSPKASAWGRGQAPTAW